MTATSQEFVFCCPLCRYEMKRPAAPNPAHEHLFCERTSCQIEISFSEDLTPKIHTFRLKSHLTRLVFPFSLFEEGQEEALERLRHSKRWTRKRFSLQDAEDVDRTEYFLPYARRFLFPGLSTTVKEEQAKLPHLPTMQHYHFDRRLIGEVGEQGLAVELFGRDDRKSLDYNYALHIKDIRLLLSGYGVGFVLIDIEHVDDISYFEQTEAAVFLRMLAPIYRGFTMPQLRVGETEFDLKALQHFLLAEFGAATSLPSSAATIDAKAALPVQPSYDDRMLVYTHSCINTKSVLEDMVQGERLIRRYAVVEPQEEDKTVPNGPSPETDPKQWLRQRWWGYSKAGGSLAIFDCDRFHERFLGLYYTTYYFDIFLLAALQRVTLLHLYERLSDIEALTTGSWGNSKMLRRVRKDLLLFKNQCWFSQLTHKEFGMAMWRRWQEVLENHILMEEVNEQSQELETYMQSQTREKVEWSVRLGGFLATAIPALLGMDVLFGKKAWVPTLQWSLMLALIIGTGIFAWIVLFRKESP